MSHSFATDAASGFSHLTNYSLTVTSPHANLPPTPAHTHVVWLRPAPYRPRHTQFDSNRGRPWRKKEDRGQHPLNAMPPPLVPSAFPAEHALAAPTYTHDLVGWGMRFPTEAVTWARSTLRWEERRPQLVWRGSAGPANANNGCALRASHP